MNTELIPFAPDDGRIAARAAQYLANEISAERGMLGPLAVQNVGDLFSKGDDINTSKLAANFRVFVEKSGKQVLEGLHRVDIITAQFIAFWASRDKAIGARQFDREFNDKIALYVIRKMWEHKRSRNQIYDSQAALSANMWFQLRAIREKTAEAANHSLRVHLGEKNGAREHICTACPDLFAAILKTIDERITELFHAAQRGEDISALWPKKGAA